MKKKIIDISTTEELVVNPDYAGWRHARIEVAIEGEHYPISCGYIRIYNNDLLFNAIRDRLENLNQSNN